MHAGRLAATTMSAPARRAALALRGVAPRPGDRPSNRTPRRPFRSLPTQQPGGGGPEDGANRQSEAAQRLKEVDTQLKALGVDRQTAQRVLKVWRKAGVEDAETLRKLFIKRGATRSAAVAVQLGVDSLSAGVAWWTGLRLAESRALGPFTLAAEFVVYTLAMYVTMSAALDAFSLVAVGVATRRYSASAPAFLESIQALAGPESGLQVVDKARRAVITVKILRALEQILGSLKDGATQADPADFFRDLSAFLVLQRAQERSGFDPAAMGVGAAEAADIAAAFAEVDQDDNGKVDSTEFRLLCGKYAPQLSAEESDAAMTVLDSDRDGTIDFVEFVQWWKGVCAVAPAGVPAEQTVQ